MSVPVVIYLSDNTGQQFVIPNGKTTTASQYLQLMIATLKLPDALAKRCFALWLKSPLLDVQLKPQHIPFRMVKQWPMLIERFSMGSDYEKAQDEPALLFRRNAFLTKEEESQITNESILDVLLMEAKLNIHQGVYPCDAEDIEQLGALMCFDIKEKEKHEIEGVVKENLPTLMPSHMHRAKKTFLNRQQSLEERVLRCAKKVSEEDSVDCTLEFMKICWQLPYYGSVIFSGFVEKAHNNALSSWFSARTQIFVKIAINTSGIWVINAEKKHVLLGLMYDEFNWEMAEPEGNSVDSGEISVACLFLEFDDKKTKSNQLLQIVSKQAPMMNSMIETCIAMVREKEQIEQAQHLAGPSNENSDTRSTQPCSSTRVRPLFARQHSVTSERPEKLTLTRMPDDDSKISVSDGENSANHPHKSAGTSKNPFRIFGSKHHKTAVTTPEETDLL